MPGPCSILDLGCGCGVVGLAVLLRSPGCVVTGVDREPALTTAALANARLLGEENRFTAVTADVGSLFQPKTALTLPSGLPPSGLPLAPASFDLVLSNPPYRILGHGRLPADPARIRALFGSRETLGLFCRAAALALKPGGRLGIIFTASRLTELCETLAECGFGALCLTPVHGREGKAPSLVLAKGEKGALAATSLGPPLILHGGHSKALSPQALAFCPFLAHCKNI